MQRIVVEISRIQNDEPSPQQVGVNTLLFPHDKGSHDLVGVSAQTFTLSSFRKSGQLMKILHLTLKHSIKNS